MTCRPQWFWSEGHVKRTEWHKGHVLYGLIKQNNQLLQFSHPLTGTTFPKVARVVKISWFYSLVIVISSNPLRFRLLIEYLPRRWNMGFWRGAATKPHSRLSTFEFGLAITNFELKISITQIENVTRAPTVRYDRTLDNKLQPQNTCECKHKPNLDSRRADRQSLFSVNTKNHITKAQEMQNRTIIQI